MKTLQRTTKLVFISCVAFGGVWLLFHVVGGLPGDPLSRASSEGLKKRQDLFHEMGDLAPGVYDTFGRAVALHSEGQHSAAAAHYQLLKNAHTRSGETRNLWVESETVAHNLRDLNSRLK